MQSHLRSESDLEFLLLSRSNHDFTQRVDAKGKLAQIFQLIPAVQRDFDRFLALIDQGHTTGHISSYSLDTEIDDLILAFL